MVEKIGTIRNPLTIIAMFAAIAEISGTLVLPFISGENQATYIWFLMIFPLLLVILFFLTLNFNHKVLYAPSDYQNEENFLKFFVEGSPTQTASKLKADALEAPSESPEAGTTNSQTTSDLSTKATSPEPKPTVDQNSSSAKPSESADDTATAVVPPAQGDRIKTLNVIRNREYLASSSLAENLIINELATELGQPIRRNMGLGERHSSILFDGLILKEDGVTAIEVKFLRDPASAIVTTRRAVTMVTEATSTLPEYVRNRFSLIIALATSTMPENYGAIMARANAVAKRAPFPVEVRLYSLDELEKKLSLRD